MQDVMRGFISERPFTATLVGTKSKHPSLVPRINSEVPLSPRAHEHQAKGLGDVLHCMPTSELISLNDEYL